MNKLKKYKLHIRNENTESQYLCVLCDNGYQYGSRLINKRELIELYHDITNCFVGNYERITDASIESNLSIYKHGENYILSCGDDGNKFHVDEYTLLPLQAEIERTLFNNIPKKWNTLNAIKSKNLKQLELF